MLVEDLFRTLQAFQDPAAIFPCIHTPYSKYSHSNYAAAGSEVPLIRDIVSQYQAQLNSIDAIVQRMNAIAHQLSNKRDQIVSLMTMHNGSVSCIRRLPYDVLCEIFVQCLPNETYPTPNIGDAPILLTRVCKGWREAALMTPRLWSSLSIADRREDLDAQLTGYRRWLENSSLCSLSLDIRLVQNFRRQPDSWQMMATKFSQLYTSRCTSLSIHFKGAGDRLHRLLMDVPNLERLHLRGSLEFPESEGPVSIVQPHPRLRTLVLEASSFDTGCLSLFDPGWTNITSLAFMPPEQWRPEDNSVFLTLLRTCPNLEHLVFSPVLIQNSRGTSVQLTHPKLRILDIKTRTETGVDLSTLEPLVFPNLRHLILDGAHVASDIFRDVSPSGPRSLRTSGSGNPTFTMTSHSFLTQHLARAIFALIDPGWTQLTHLQLNLTSPTPTCFMPLQFCPRLDTMVVSVSIGSVPVISMYTYTPPVHRALRSLTLRVTEGAIGRLLDGLTVPGLRHVELGMGKDWEHVSFEAFVSKSRCSLDTLTISAARMSVGEREALASLLPTSTLMQLDLHGDTTRTERSGDVSASY